MDQQVAPKPTDEELTRLRKTLLIDKGPSSRQQSYQFVYWRQQGDLLGQPFDATKIPMSKLYQMRRDPMISFALHFIKVPLIRAPWYIRCDDAQIAAFVDYSLRRIYSRLVMQYMQSLDFGFTAIVKRFELHNPTGAMYIDPADPEKTRKPIWDEGNVDAIVWKSFVGLPPEQVNPRWNRQGEFNGIQYDNKKDVPLAFPMIKGETDDQVNVPLELSLWITNERDTNFGTPWGYPRIGYAFRYWWSYWYRWALADRHFEKDADPPAVVRYPDDPRNETIDDFGNTVDYREIALGIGEQARSGSTIAMPSNTIENELDGRPTNTPQWDVNFVEGGTNFDAFDQTFDRLEILKLRSIWVPEQAFLEGKGGTSSRNVAETLGNSFEESQAVLMAEFDDHINRYVIPQLVEVNFPEFRGVAQKITRSFGSDDMAMAKELVQLIGQADPNKLEVDSRSILEQFDVPLKTPDVVKAEKDAAMKEAMEMAAISGPAAGVEPVSGGSAGTTGPTQKTPQPTAKKTNTGFAEYIQAPERISLAEDEEFVAMLPASPHYADRGILAMTREHRAMWRDIYEEAYGDFATYMRAQAPFEGFADDDDQAKNFIDKWVSKFGDAKDRAQDIIKKIMARAANMELKRAKLPTSSFDPSSVTPSSWAAEHAAELVTKVDDTVRRELRVFLSDQIRRGLNNDEIAENIRAHFSQFPDWKADRLARTETMLAYNYATLFAGEAAGVKRVQAIDAQKGPTDEDCERRNGKIFDLPAAYDENIKEHPNGTLSWRLLRQTQLSVQSVPRSEVQDDKLAWYDPTTDTIYMVDDISPDDSERYLYAIGERLADA